MKKILIIISFIIPTILAGQELNIQGSVFDNDDNLPLYQAAVYFENEKIGTFTNEEGIFNVRLPEKDQYTLSVEHIGYKLYTREIEKNDLNDLNIGLTTQPFFIEQILVNAPPAHRSAQSDILHDPTKKFSQPRDIGDLFRDVPGFNVVKRGGYAMDPVFRSFRNEQLNVQYDGGIQVMHACPNRMDPITTHVIPEEVENIELIKGPFSVRYGQTMGGILNIITTTPDPSDQFTIGGSVEGGFETNGNSKLTRLTLNTANKNYDAVINGGIRDFGNYKNGDNLEIPSSFKSYDYSAKLGINTAQNQRLQLGWRQSFGRDIQHVGLPMDTDEDNSKVVSVDYLIKNLSPALYSITFKGFLSKVDHIMTNRNRPNFMMVDGTATVDALTAGGKLEFSIIPGAKNQLYAGMDFRYLARDGERVRLMKRNMMTGEPIDPPMRMVDLIWQDALQTDLGVFVENRVFTNSNFTFTTGIRADFIGSEIKNPAADFLALYPELGKRTEINVSGNLTAEYRINKDWDVEWAIGRGTRTANMEERYINHFTLGADAYEYVGNPDLKAEANHQTELSLNKNKGNFQLKVSAFYSYITNYITAAVDETLDRKFMPMMMPQNARRFQNIDEATQTGFEIQTEYKFANYFTATALASYTRAQNLDWDEPLPEIPPFSALLGLAFQKEWITVDFRGRYASDQNRISESFGESSTPDFFVFDVRLGIRPTEQLSIGTSMLNVFDANYYEHLNRGYRNTSEQGLIYEPGRNITAFVKYEF